jgi:hypothetical protein
MTVQRSLGSKLRLVQLDESAPVLTLARRLVCTDTGPQIAAVGFTEEEAVKAGIDVIVGSKTTELIAEVFLRTPNAKRFQKIASQLFHLGVKANLVRLKVAYFHSRVVSPALYRATVRLLEFFAISRVRDGD